MADQTFPAYVNSRGAAGALAGSDILTVVRGSTGYQSTLAAVATLMATAMSALAVSANTIELGHASDTTLARIAAGRVSIEGHEIATLDQTQTFTGVKTLTTPVLGVATATSINKVAITAPATGSTLTIADGKTLTASNTITFTATDGSTLAIGAGGTLGTAAYKATGTSGNTVPLLDGANTWSRGQTITQSTDTYDFSIGRATGAPSVRLFSDTTSTVNLYMGDTSLDSQGGLRYNNSVDTLYLRAASSDILSVASGSVVIATTGVPFTVNSTNSNTYKLAWSNNGSSLGYLGADGTYCLYVGSSGSSTFTTVTNATGLLRHYFSAQIDGSLTMGGDIQINKATAGLDLISTGSNITNIQLRNGTRYDDIRNTSTGLQVRCDTSGTPKLWLFGSSGGLVCGSPSAGGDKGVGTINAQAVYDDNVLLTDLVLDMAVDGSFDRIAYAKHPVADIVKPWWFDADQYAEFWKANRYLPGMISWTDEKHRPSTGEIATRLTAVVETHAVHLANDNDRIKALEAEVASLKAKLAA